MAGADRCVNLRALGCYLPSRVMTNDDWAQFVDTSDEWITARTGIKRRRIAADDETTVTLAAAAARDALARHRISAGDIDEIIVATDTPEVYVPDTASFLQHCIGARGVPSYTLGGSGCTGFVQALDIAVSRVRSGTDTLLIAGVELLTRIVSWRDRNTCVLFGDGAGAIVVGAAPGFGRVLHVVCGTAGGNAGFLGIEVGGTRHPFSLEAARQGLHQRATLHGREVFRSAVHWMSEAAHRVLQESGTSLGDVALFIPHQANLRIIEAVAKSLALPADRCFVNLGEYGNTGSASIPIALWEARETGRIRGGDLVLVTAFGAGYHWGAALLQF